MNKMIIKKKLNMGGETTLSDFKKESQYIDDIPRLTGDDYIPEIMMSASRDKELTIHRRTSKNSNNNQIMKKKLIIKDTGGSDDGSTIGGWFPELSGGYGPNDSDDEDEDN